MCDCVCVCVYDVTLTYEKTADRSVDLLENVADHIESSYKAELQGIVDHHADEHDVPRVLVEETRVKQVLRHGYLGAMMCECCMITDS